MGGIHIEDNRHCWAESPKQSALSGPFSDSSLRPEGDVGSEIIAEIPKFTVCTQLEHYILIGFTIILLAISAGISSALDT
jgi:hypothetical protein